MDTREPRNRGTRTGGQNRSDYQRNRTNQVSRPSRREDYDEEEYTPRQRRVNDEYDDVQANVRRHKELYVEPPVKNNKNKIILGVVIAGAAALAIGIGELISNSGKVSIVSVQPSTLSAQQPYQDCQQVRTTSYSRNHKSGTEGAIIGGAGGAAVGGLVSHSWVGAGVGAAVGAVGGDLVERSNQPDYVAHHGSTNECKTSYRPIQVPVGYQVGYLSDGQVVQIVTAHQPEVGSKVSLKELEADQVTPEQQQQLIQQAINGGNQSSGQNAQQGG